METTFIDQLNKDIAEHQSQYNNVQEFIKKKKLKAVPARNESDAPTKLYFGTSYIIGRGTIIEIYSWADPAFSLSVAFDYEVPKFQSTMTVHKISDDDVGYQFYMWIKNNNDTIFTTNMDDLNSMVFRLLKLGLTLYV